MEENCRRVAPFAARGLGGESAAGDTASEASDAVVKASDSAICVP
jgi:hypothetical protein